MQYRDIVVTVDTYTCSSKQATAASVCDGFRHFIVVNIRHCPGIKIQQMKNLNSFPSTQNGFVFFGWHIVLNVHAADYMCHWAHIRSVYSQVQLPLNLICRMEVKKKNKINPFSDEKKTMRIEKYKKKKMKLHRIVTLCKIVRLFFPKNIGNHNNPQKLLLISIQKNSCHHLCRFCTPTICNVSCVFGNKCKHDHPWIEHKILYVYVSNYLHLNC